MLVFGEKIKRFQYRFLKYIHSIVNNKQMTITAEIDAKKIIVQLQI